MTDKELKKIYSANLTTLRKARKMTQLQLAEKLNYTDKAVSKWECGDVMPDVETVVKIAEIFEVSVDSMLGVNGKKPDASRFAKNFLQRNSYISALSFGLVWLVATVIFFALSLFNIEYPLIFIIALPVSCLVLMIMLSIYFGLVAQTVSISLFVWSISIMIYAIIPAQVWSIFIVACVLQALIVFWYLLRRTKIKK